MGLHLVVSLVFVASIQLSFGQGGNSSNPSNDSGGEVVTLPASSDNHLSIPNNTDQENSSGVCHSIDVRNEVSNLEQLKGCRLVEGYVQVCNIY